MLSWHVVLITDLVEKLPVCWVHNSCQLIYL